MSLTRELNNQHSPLTQWFEQRFSYKMELLAAHHNREMTRSPKIVPQGEIENFGLLGTAFIYGFRWHWHLLKRAQLCETLPAYIAAEHLGQLNNFFALLKAKNTTQKAIACLVFAGWEQYYRSGRVLPILTSLMRNGHCLKPSRNLKPIIEDLVCLLETIPSTWNSHSFNVTNVCFNPTFAGSYYLAADAQLISSNTIIRCYTTLKHRPMTKKHLYQQLAYALMDWDDRYNLTHLCWYYSRQQAIFIHPLKQLVALEQMRCEFREFLISNY